VLRVIPKSYSCLPSSESQKIIIDIHPQPFYRATLCVSAVFAVVRSLSVPGAPAGFQARVGKIRRKAPKNFFRLLTLVFSLPTLPYVSVAHPAHRTEADLREKASLATNQEGPSPPLTSV